MTKNSHGAFLRADLERSLGDTELRAAIKEGRLRPYSKRVLLAGDQAARFNTLAAATLLHAGPEAVLTGHTAARLHGCSAANVAPIQVLVPVGHRFRSRPGVVVHHGDHRPRDVEHCDSLRVLALDCALAELLCRGSRPAALACVNQALATLGAENQLAFTDRVLKRVLARPDARGWRRATTVLRLATGLPESPAESWTLLALVDAGFPPPMSQYPVLDLTGRERYRLDFAWPDFRIAVEYDGYAAHEGREDADARRDEDLRRRGWIIIRATAHDLTAPGRLVASVRDAFQHLQAVL